MQQPPPQQMHSGSRLRLHRHLRVLLVVVALRVLQFLPLGPVKVGGRTGEESSNRTGLIRLH